MEIEDIKREINSIGVFITQDQAMKNLIKLHIQEQIDLLAHVLEFPNDPIKLPEVIENKIQELTSQLNQIDKDNGN